MSVAMEMHLANVAARSRLGMPQRKPRMLITRAVPVPAGRSTAPAKIIPHFAPFNFFARPSATAIIKLVALKHGVGYYDVIGRNNRKVVTAARHEAVRLVASHCRDMSSTQVGRIFHRDHSSILYILGRHKRKTGVKGGGVPVDNHVYPRGVVDRPGKPVHMEDHLLGRRVV